MDKNLSSSRKNILVFAIFYVYIFFHLVVALIFILTHYALLVRIFI